MKTSIVTGANTGIGAVTAKALAERGDRVILACRSEEKTRPVIENYAVDNYYDMDPDRTIAVMQKVEKPWIAYKVLAAGRSVNSPKEVRERMAVALNGIKPTDPVIIGLYQRFNDQIGQTADFVREILA